MPTTNLITVGRAESVATKTMTAGFASSGSNTIISIPSDPTKTIQILGIFLISAGTVNLYFTDTTGAVVFGDSTTKINLVANVGFVVPPVGAPWAQCAKGAGFNGVLSGSVGVSGQILYRLV